MLDPAQVKALVDAIRNGGYDPEVMHADEDDMFVTVLRSIADGTATSPQDCAKEALRSLEIDFPRWCA